MTITLRMALPSDKDAVVALIHQLNVYEADLTGDRLRDHAAADRYHDELQQRLAKNNGRVVVATEAGQVVAAMGFAIQVDAAYVVDDLRRHGVVTDLVVDAHWRGRGIGQRLLAEAERLTREAGLTRLAIGALAANRRAETTYLQFGFEPYVSILVKRV